MQGARQSFSHAAPFCRLAIAGTVADKFLQFETPIREVFDWWPQHTNDSRSAITLRHLLTFTSGVTCNSSATSPARSLSSRVSGCGVPCLAFTDHAPRVPIESCAQQILSNATWRYPPGVAWTYHSLHLQLAGAMAAKVTTMPLPCAALCRQACCSFILSATTLG